MQQLPTDTMGQRIKVVRKRANLTQRQLAAKLDRHEDYVSKLERDEFTPSLEIIIQIVNETNSSLDFIVLGKDTEAYERAFDMLSVLPMDERNEMIGMLNNVLKLLCKRNDRE